MLLSYNNNYFLVGGYDINSKTGKIFLYKINYGEKAYKTTIEKVQELFKDNDDENIVFGSINCITQSTTTGNILVSCSDGKYYRLTIPKFKNDLKKENK